MGVKALRKIQLGQESTGSFGTPVAATTIWRGRGTLVDNRETVFPEEDVGIGGGTDRSYVPRLEAALPMDEVEATYEQLPYIFEAAWAKVATGSSDSSGSGYIYSYTIPTTSANNILAFTIEGGDDEDVEEMEYSFVESFSMSGSAGEAWMMSADWIGRQATSTGVSFTTGIAVPSVEEILFSKTKLYIDDSTGSYGSTQVSNALLSANVDATTGLKPKYTADGQKYFSFHYWDGEDMEIMLDVTFEHDSNATTEKSNWRNEIARLIRLKAEGAALSSSGTYANKTLIVDLPGKWESFSAIEDEDGNDIVTGTFRSRYNADVADAGKFIVINENASLT